MSIMLEGISIIVLLEDVHERYKGGFAQFMFDQPSLSRFCNDGKIAGISLKSYEEVDEYLKLIAKKGLRVDRINFDDATSSDYADVILIDQSFGPNINVNWLSYDWKQISKGDVIMYAWSKFDQDDISIRIEPWDKEFLVVPDGWELKNSETKAFAFFRMAERKSFSKH